MNVALDHDPWADVAPMKSIWLITLVDLLLLLIGFFVLLQAHQEEDRAALLAGLRDGFAAQMAPVDQLPPNPMAVARARVEGFAPNSAKADVAEVIAWASDVVRDDRTQLTITGSTALADDIDLDTGSAAILAADRARHVAAALVRHAGINPSQITLIVAPGNRRAVTLTVGYAGDPIEQAGEIR